LNPHKRTFAAPTSQLPFEPAYRYSSTLSVPQPSRGPSPSSSIASALNEQISLETLYRFPSSYSGAATRPSRHPSPASASEIAVVQSESPPSPQGKHCSHCYVTSTPLWRRNPETYEILCNACGLYLHQHHKLRPPGLIDTDEEDDVGESVYGALVCAQCNSHRTSTWRRGKDGERLCNACGVYIRLRGMDRPMSLWKKKIRPRCKRAL
jgi:ribosomal protein L34E